MPPAPTHLRKAQFRDALIYWLYLPAAVIGGGKVIDLLGDWPPPPFPYLSTQIAASALLLGGVLLIAWATHDFRHFGDGTPNPQAPPQCLVTRGSYALCRHPMFFGYDLAALGTILLFRSWGMLLVTYPLLLIGQFRFLKREETRLEHRFGEQYARYRQRAPFLLPNPFAKRDSS